MAHGIENHGKPDDYSDATQMAAINYLSQMKDLFATDLGDAVELLLILSQRTDERDRAVEKATSLTLLKEAIIKLN